MGRFDLVHEEKKKELHSFKSHEFDGTTQIPFVLASARKMNWKLGMPVLLTEHSFMNGGLVSGMWLVITGMYNGFLKAQITSGEFKGDE
ncbi:hypothetical protein MJO28_014684 [Puccinia striiformis f. sp. tritici]|uniref:Uncharacterized protein n=1 Tax=Puccinia striiformis f. sp. tritici TaxID=168172 RepID=A0ACC0DWB1_9BASI|nr:hypothetical protein MJO28_014684 [Puccinia striiformis f. sp. tritici]